MTRDVACYIRTSTDGQDGQAQRHQLERATAGVDEPIRWYVDVGESGAKTSRPELDRLKRDTAAGEVSAVYVSALDRLGRSAVHVLTMLNDWTRAGVRVVSLREGQSIDPSTPIGRAVASILAAVAELERDLIRERVRSGVKRAQERGTRSGRPIGRPSRGVDADEVRRRRAAGESWRTIAQAMKAPTATIRRAVSKTTP